VGDEFVEELVVSVLLELVTGKQVPRVHHVVWEIELGERLVVVDELVVLLDQRVVELRAGELFEIGAEEEEEVGSPRLVTLWL
jgi:hypothetical protein